MRDWQPIETAPHAISLLLFIPATTHTQWDIVVGMASHGQRLPNGYSNMSWHGSATHWMPLPEPPKGDAP